MQWKNEVIRFVVGWMVRVRSRNLAEDSPAPKIINLGERMKRMPSDRRTDRHV